jgi:hypothetical protein
VSRARAVIPRIFIAEESAPSANPEQQGRCAALCPKEETGGVEHRVSEKEVG